MHLTSEIQMKKSEKSIKQRKKLALEVIERLKKEYPNSDCTLTYDRDQAWKLLVSVRLAAQCTDARVNVVVEELYRHYPDVNALADAEVDEIEKLVHPCGLGNSKARDISACMKVLRDKYQERAPDTCLDIHIKNRFTIFYVFLDIKKIAYL